MESDEKQIRKLVSDWMAATRDGDLDHVLSLMTDDVVFLTPGRPPMRKVDFAASAREQAAGQAPKFEGRSEIEEIVLAGGWAFMRSHLEVTATPPGGGAQTKRSGYTLTVLKKQDGRWLLARDANLLAPGTH